MWRAPHTTLGATVLLKGMFVTSKGHWRNRVTCNLLYWTFVQPQLMLTYHHQPICSWADRWQLYCQVVVNQAWKSTVIACRNDKPKWKTNTTRRVERKTYPHCTQGRQSAFWIARGKRGALERLCQSAMSQEATWWKRRMVHAWDAIVHIFESSWPVES